MTFDVSLYGCERYEPALLDEALARAADAAGMPDLRGKRILVKPNLLNASAPEKAVTTHPEFLAAAIRLLKARGAARILVGDSPGWQQAKMAAGVAGFTAVVRREGVEWADFKPGNPRECPDGEAVQRIVLASAVDEVDLILNLPKLKTHRLMRYTGATKNLLGLMPGTSKSAMHLRFPDRNRFGAFLVDLSTAAGPVFTLMDAIVGMEGEGPGSGDPRQLGLVLGSNSMAALDWIAASLIGYDPESIPYLANALRRSGRNPGNPGISVGGLDPATLRVADWKLIPETAPMHQFLGKMPGMLRAFIGQVSASRPTFDAEKCIGCRGCVNICPAAALDLPTSKARGASGAGSRARHQVRIDDAACILCYCCHEVCPVHAIELKHVMARTPGKGWKSSGRTVPESRGRADAR